MESGLAAAAGDADTLDGLDSTDLLSSAGGSVDGDLGVGTAAAACRLHVVDDLSTPFSAAQCVDFSTSVDSTRTTGIDVVSFTLTTKGQQDGVRAQTSVDSVSHPQKGEAFGSLATSVGWDLEGIGSAASTAR